MEFDENIRKLLAETRVKMHPKNYTIVSFDRREEEKARKFLGELGIFSSVTFDTAEVSLVLRTEEWNQLKGRFESFREEGPYRLITFDIVLDLSIVGFLAVISSRLAEAGISIYALSTFLRDHILVKGEEAEEAMCVLQRLVDECRKR